MKHLRLLLALWAGPALAQPTGGTVILHVGGVPGPGGHVRVAVCNAAEFLHDHCAFKARAPAVPGTTTVVVQGVPPGTYAVQAWDDANDNGEIDRNWLGIPTEAIGFSRDAPIHFGPPRFADAAVQIGPAGAELSFSLRRF